MRIVGWKWSILVGCSAILLGCPWPRPRLGPEVVSEGARDFDVRSELSEAAAVGPSEVQLEAEERLRVSVPELRVVHDPWTGGARSLSGVTAPLSEPGPGDPELILRQYVEAHLDLMGLTLSDVADLELRDTVPGSGGAAHLVLRQRHRGLPVHQGLLQGTVAADGRILGLTSGLAPHLADATTEPVPSRSAAEAVRAALVHLGQGPAGTPRELSGPHGVEWETAVDSAGISREPILARLTWVPVVRNDVRLAWSFVVHTLDGDHVYEFTVDARDGRVLTRFDRVFEAEYRVYARPIESPDHTTPAPPADARTPETDPQDPVASPWGWHRSDGSPGGGSTELRGNNVLVYADRFDVDTPPATLTDCGPSLDCNFPLNLSAGPGDSLDAIATNVFYWSNLFHDVMWHHGFGPASGAFQVNNDGADGVAGDPVLAEVQDGWGTGTELLCRDPSDRPVLCRNNASFTTSADGTPGRLELQVWDAATPERDGGLDAGIVVHELAHGLSGRLVGGPAATGCLGGVARGLAEGVSDYLGLVFTQTMAHDAAAPRPLGTYPSGEPPTGPGIREEPYTLDPALNGAHYERVRECLPVASDGYPHCAGEIWTQLLWGLHWDLIDRHGFSTELVPTASRSGNQRMLAYLVEALKATRCGADFLDGRDGLLLATLASGEVCTFARRLARFGLGSGAVRRTSEFNGPGNGHGIPTSCLGTLDETWLHNPEPRQGDDFGRTVVIRGDTALVGAPLDENASVRSGAVFVFVRGPAGWVRQAKLTPSGGVHLDRFGAAVDLKGDFAIVGAWGRDLPRGGTDAGEAYVFRRVVTPSGVRWEQEGPPLQAWSPGRDHRFGYSVAIDSRRRVAVIGAPGYEGAGAALVFERVLTAFGPEWVPQGDVFFATRALLRASPQRSGARFGEAVAFANDGETILVGAPGDDTLATEAGSAHVFTRSAASGSFFHDARFLPQGAPAGAQFGSSVALGVDLGQSGDPTLAVVGAPGTAGGQGGVYLYTRPRSGWIDGVVPVLPRPLHWGPTPAEAAGDRFGSSVDVSGDLLVVGAPGDRAALGRGTGSAFLFDRRGTAWLERSRIRRMADTGHDRFAAATSVSAATVLVGADRDYDTDSGSVFFYE